MQRLVSVPIIAVALGALGACKDSGNSSPPALLQSVVELDSATAAGLNKVATREAHSVDLAVAGGTLFAAWHEFNGTAQQIRVASYSGSGQAWSFVDGDGTKGINKDETKAAVAPRLAVVGSKLYATWLETAALHDQVRVAVYSGNAAAPAWTFVDGAGANGLNRDPSADASDPQLAVVGSKLYAVWAEPDAEAVFQIRAAVYNGNDAAPAWAQVDGGGVLRNGAQHVTPRAAVLGDKLYVLWVEQLPELDVLRAAVYGGNDSAPAWASVEGTDGGLARSATGSAGYPSLAAADGKLYAAFTETRTDANPAVHVSVYGGKDSSPSWKPIDGDASSALRQHDGFATETALGAKGGVVYVAWVEAGENEPTRLRLAGFNGKSESPSWAWVAGSGTTALNRDAGVDAQAGLPRLLDFREGLILGWNEDNDIADQIRVSFLRP